MRAPSQPVLAEAGGDAADDTAGPRRQPGARWRRATAVAAPGAVAGLVIALSLAPWGWWPLGPAGAALLSWRLAGLRWRARLAAGWTAGLGCFVPGLWWAASFTLEGALVLMAAEAVFFAAAALLVPPTGRWRPAALAGAFTLLEAGRQAFPFGGLPLGGVFLGQADGPLLAAARLGGPLLVTGLVWLAGAGLAELAGATIGRVRGRGVHARLSAAVACAVVVAAVATAGALAPAGGPVVGRLPVAAVQGGSRTGVLEAETAATLRLVGDPVRLVVWPEDAVSVGRTLAGTPQATALGAIARSLHATLVVGVTETVSAHAFKNLAVVFGSSGRVVATYEKVRRVPFGEYIPDRSFFSRLATLKAVPLTAVPGHASGMVDTPVGRLGLLVSYEVFFADRGRSAVRAGAELLVVPTNTTSYVTSQVPGTEEAAARFQAVEEGRDLVQAAPTGFSLVVRSSGAVAAHSILGARQVLTATVDLRRGSTPYEAAGDLPPLVAAAVGLGGALVAARRRRRYS